MQLRIYKDYDELSVKMAEETIDLVKTKPDAVLCLASGDSPRLAYTLMVKKAKEENTDLSKCFFIGLDEWVNIPPQNSGSCHFFLHTYVFDPLQISSSQIHLFNALSKDPAHECKTMDEIISEKGGIDLMVVGIGMNGHIGFNEPGVSFNKYSHVIDLDNTTQSVGQKYFQHTAELKKGITLGLKHLSEAKKIILVASGTNKAGIIKKALEEEISSNIPASIIRTHLNSIVMIDEEAASLLSSGFARE